MSLPVLPTHKSIGKKNYNAVKNNELKYQPLKDHFEYLKNLGEVQAMQAVAMLIHGNLRHAKNAADRLFNSLKQ